MNRYRLPGTTVDTRVKGVNDGRNYRSKQNVRGRVVVDLGFVRRLRDGAGWRRSAPLVANKAWFTFDDEIVALGSGINDPGLTGTGWDGTAKHVETIVEDRRLESTASGCVVDGKAITSSTTDRLRESVVGADRRQRGAGAVGYTFPGSGPLRASTTDADRVVVRGQREERRRRPRAPTRTSHSGSITAQAPANATYSYVRAARVRRSRRRRRTPRTPETTVLANSTTVAAVKETTKNAVGAVFWRDATATVMVGGAPFLTSSARSVVMTEESATGIDGRRDRSDAGSKSAASGSRLDRAASGVDLARAPASRCERLTPDDRPERRCHGREGTRVRRDASATEPRAPRRSASPRIWTAKRREGPGEPGAFSRWNESD